MTSNQEDEIISDFAHGGILSSLEGVLLFLSTNFI